MHDSVVSLLKYLDKKREKYAVTKEVRFYVKLVRNMTQIKRVVAVKREWEYATAMAKERVASLSYKCATVKVVL